MKLQQIIIIGVFFLASLTAIPQSAQSDKIINHPTLNTCGNYTYYVGTLAIHPGSFPTYSPKLQIKFNSKLPKKLYAPHEEKMTLIVNWEIKDDCPLWTDEFWGFYFELRGRGVTLAYENLEKNDKAGHDDAGHGKLVMKFSPRKDAFSIFGHHKSYDVVLEISIIYKRSDDKWEKEGEKIRTIIVENEAPETPTLKGPNTLKPYEEGEFTACSNDPDGDDIQYQFCINGVNTEWSSPLESGKSITIKENFPRYYVGKTIEIKVRARDTFYHEVSDWSEPLYVKIVRRRSSDSNSDRIISNGESILNGHIITIK